MAASKVPGGDDVGLGEVIEFMRLLWAVDHGLSASSKHMDARFGITGPQRLVIRIVGRHPGIAAGRIAEILHVHPSTLTGILARLVERRVLTRRRDPADGRRALFSLTAAGEQLDGLRSGTIEAKVRRALVTIPPRELSATRRVLAALAESLDRGDAARRKGTAPARKRRAAG